MVLVWLLETEASNQPLGCGVRVAVEVSPPSSATSQLHPGTLPGHTLLSSLPAFRA
ncbi:mCG1050948 [Mus musculus]|nr:mCG1050948 [Mus musculus]